MNLNLSLYKSVIPAIRTIIKNNPNVEKGELVSLASIGTGAHIVICGYFLSYISGHIDDYKSFIDNLTKFYKIESILNVEEFFDETGRSKESVEGSPSL